MQTATDTPATTGEHWIKDPAGAFGAWDRWTKSTGLPVHQGYFIPDLRTVELLRGGVEPLASGFFPVQALTRAAGWVFIPPESEGFGQGATVEMRPLP